MILSLLLFDYFYIKFVLFSKQKNKKTFFFCTCHHCKLNPEYESEATRLFFLVHTSSLTINILKGKSGLKLQYWFSSVLWILLWVSSVSLCLQWGYTDVCTQERNLYTQAEEWTCQRNLMLWIDALKKIKNPFLRAFCFCRTVTGKK